MNMPGPNSGIARFLTKICDLIFLNVVFILTSCTVVCLGAAVTALYMTAMELYQKRDCTPVRDFLRNLRKAFTASTPAAVLLLADLTLLAVLCRVLYAGTLLFPPELFVLFCISAVILTAILSWLFPLLACFENTFSRHFWNAVRLALARLPITFFITALNLLPILVLLFMPQFFGAFLGVWLLIGAAAGAYGNLFYLRRIFKQ